MDLAAFWLFLQQVADDTGIKHGFDSIGLNYPYMAIATVASNSIVHVLKASPNVRVVNRASDWINRILSATLAFLSTVGITFTYHFDAAAGQAHLVFGGLFLKEIVSTLLQTAVQFGGNEAAYRGIWKNIERLKEMHALLKSITKPLP